MKRHTSLMASTVLSNFTGDGNDTTFGALTATGDFAGDTGEATLTGTITQTSPTTESINRLIQDR